MPDETSAGAVIFKKQDKTPVYLLLHYVSGHWDFVKGHIEKGEDHKTTVIRETKEETGLDTIMFVNGLIKRIEYFYNKKGRTSHKEVFFYLAETKNQPILLSHEHIGYQWLEYPDAYDKLTFKNAKDVLEKANKLVDYVGSN